MKHKFLTPLFAVLLILSISCKENNQNDQVESKVTQEATESETDEIQKKIREAMSSAPSSISANATILDYPKDPKGKKIVLRKGTNGWICLPDNPHMPGNNPMCIDEQIKELFTAIAENREPVITRTGFGYFLQGGAPRSNANPWDTVPTPDNEWMEHQVPHIVVVSPDKSILDSLPTKMDNGGPWVMWKNTPYAHIMIPVPKNTLE
ncbi:hypothetical protein [Algibacter luteus]|uniref:hypothetical protein n=1 Tax=Algibacter luteus TaxID=1178825 RepID=UPI0025971F3E|nr:hypothetical protein [Algibacter luteus]WJJ96570.1 hypothetical protein O5O44_15255 [Algibacter luteus]